MSSELVIRDLHVQVEDKEILKGVNLTLRQGQTHALMGKNGSGKSTLASTLMGHPSYKVTQGEVLLDGENILELAPDERARKGLFLAFQYPSAVPGVSTFNFLRTAYNAVHPRGEGAKPMSVRDFRKLLATKLVTLKMDEEFLKRYLNDGFSGGEKKRAEILQMAVLAPKFAVLDETDSGLDIDALRIVADGVNAQRGPDLGALVITHYQRLLNYIVPDFVHIMLDGRIVTTGGKELALEMEAKGYDWIEQQFGQKVEA
ncbi:MAG TPA: Fe-S cluster assembly ATPase SufC [Chloroflexota bacterium]|jgi:Fe-S cluster assembly ATP-binding protein|nr:Fe-S cluster assembly ATPase SufC [Chloroflexota bacterium]